MRTIITRLVASTALCCALTICLLAADEKIEPANLPRAVSEAVKARFPDARFTSITKETVEGEVVFDIELTQEGRKFETDIKQDGTVLEIEKEMAIKDLPKALNTAVEDKFPKATIKEVLEVNMVTGKQERPDHYEVVLETADKQEVEVMATLDGKTLMQEVASAGAATDAAKRGDAAWSSDFTVEKSDLASTGRNRYFVLEPGYQLVYEDGPTKLVITVLNETKTVDGVATRVIEERETKDGQPSEVSRNFFAISKKSNDVYYFGEDVDVYEGGKIANHGGAWLAGAKGAKFGLLMPGKVLLGARHYQEIAPGAAMDRAEVVSTNETVKTPAGEFQNCLKVEETTPLEPGVKEYKYYAPGIGLVQDGSLKLVKYGKNEPTKKKNSRP